MGSPKGTLRQSISGPKPKLKGRFVFLPAPITAAKVSKPIIADAKQMARMSRRLGLWAMGALIRPRQLAASSLLVF
jgi:hypothetical protein